MDRSEQNGKRPVLNRRIKFVSRFSRSLNTENKGLYKLDATGDVAYTLAEL
jgi:hypothetical protein